MASSQFHHLGVPTSAKHDNEIYIEGGKVYATDPAAHPYRVEFLRFEPDSPMPDAIKTGVHAAFLVDNLDAALKGQKVVLPPFDATDELRVAFIEDGGALIEIMEKR
ncbi:MAG: hypothetical protein JXQ73_10230 [Phycisphaerae bacterium]|nr:hypothetical protein [Phycisphaerae bacterium]